jgi:hypothetical protein
MFIALAPGVNFINIFTYKFSVQMSFRQLFLVTFWLWQKIRTKNADEIEGSFQFQSDLQLNWENNSNNF